MGGNGKASVEMPFIMPDGRPLSAWLSSYMVDNHGSGESNRHRSKKKKQRARKERREGWTSNQYQCVQVSRNPSALSEAEQIELEALRKVGQRRQRRWLNDKLLRDMTPAMTAKEMQGLFQPAPFGETGHTSMWAMASLPEVAPLWDLFRSVEMDKQDRVLQKWESYLQQQKKELVQEESIDISTGNESPEQREKSICLQMAAAGAQQGWAAVGPRGRKALRRAPFNLVENLESRILELCHYGGQDGQGSEKEVVFTLENGFERLLVHSLAIYHSLSSFSREIRGKGKVVIVRKRKEHLVSSRKQFDSRHLCRGEGSSSAPRLLCCHLLCLFEEGKTDMSVKSLYNILMSLEENASEILFQSD